MPFQASHKARTFSSTFHQMGKLEAFKSAKNLRILGLAFKEYK